ncbi:MAG: TonB-dependent receptor family protein [Gammaproteobacteria bacterium]
MKAQKFFVLALITAAGSQSVLADEAEQLPTMEVVESSELTTPSIEAARAELARVPGATTLIDAEDFNERVVTNIADVLQLLPGVFAQSRFGGSETRLSIRGSGITQTFGIRGVRFLRDGLPVTNASGFTNPELIEPNIARYVSVYRGANALEYGASTLGGAVNFVSRTGRNSEGLNVNLMTDTEHNYYRPQIRGGGLLGDNMDYFVSLSGLFNDGFREQSHEEVKRGYGNFAIRHNDRQETRFHFYAADNRLELPGSLRRAQLFIDSSKTSGEIFDKYGVGTFGDKLFDWAAHNASRNIVTYRGDIHHTILLGDDDRLDIGTWYENRDLDHPLPFVIIASESNETGASLRYEDNHQLFGFDNRLVAGGLWAWGDSDGKNYNTIIGGGEAVKNGLRSTTRDESYTLEWFAEDQFSLTEDLRLVLGGQVSHSKRRQDENCVVLVANCQSDQNNSRSYTGFSPKLGFVWQALDNVQIFGNASRNYEPPTTTEFAAGVRAKEGKLDAQESTVLEIGTRGGYEWINWDLAFYHAWLQDEILMREDPTSPGQGLAQNGDHTRHMGVEVGVNAAVPLGLFGEDELSIRTNYTHNRFTFDDDSEFGNNKLPAIPENIAQVEVLYKHPAGFYAGPNIQYADNYFVDYANTQKADAYTIYGFRAGYTFAERYSVFFEGRNLADRKWISNTGVDLNSGGGDPRQFNPGYDRNFFFGVSVDLL